MEAFFFPLAYLFMAILMWFTNRSVPVTGGEAVLPAGSRPPLAFAGLIGELTSGFDLTFEMQRKGAYNRCYEYASEKLADSEQCNLFLAEAAQVLGQAPVRIDVIDPMAAPTGAERINVVSSGNYGIVLTGNRDGLSYLSRVMEFLSRSPIGNEYVYLRGDNPPMVGDTFGLTVYYEPDEWFDKYAQGNPAQDEYEEPYIPGRKIAAAAVVALCVTVEPPLKIFLSKDKIFRVISFEGYDGKEGIPTKRIRESFSRMYVFTLVDDRGQEIEIAFDLDDWDIVYFSMGDLEQLIQ